MVKSSITTYPGSGSYYVICDICGIKLRRNEATLVVNKYSPNKNLLVCHKDLDEKNDKDRPIVARETLMPDPKYVRQEVSDSYLPNVISDRLASKPNLLTATLSPLENVIQLTWFGPDDAGSSRILGYQITRSSPQFHFDVIIEVSTDSDATYYIDEDADINLSYTYTVSAITDVGIGARSDYGFYPSQQVSSNISYVEDGNGLIIQDGNGEYILDGASF